jgi:carbamoyl-phosphate synthase large subunit
MAVKDNEVYVLEVNPRASRTVPFVSKSIGLPLAKIAAKVMAGQTLEGLGVEEPQRFEHVTVKEAVLPFGRFPEVDTILGPEMKSTGEVMGIDTDFGLAFAKAEMAAGASLPDSGKIFISVSDPHKSKIIPIAVSLDRMGFEIHATKGTAEALEANGVEVNKVLKLREGRPNIVDLIKSGEIKLVINTPWGKETRSDGYYIRTAATYHGVPCITTISGAMAAVRGIEAMKRGGVTVQALQEYHEKKK